MRVALGCAIKKAQLAARRSGISHVERIVTDGAPPALVEDLQPATGIGTVTEAEVTFVAALSWKWVRNTLHTNVFAMTAVVAAPPRIGAIHDPVLPIAAKVIQQDWVCAPTMRVALKCTVLKTQIAASGMGISDVERVVTDCAPGAIMVNLQPAAAVGTVVEAEAAFSTRCIISSVPCNAFDTHVFVMAAVVAAPAQKAAISEPHLLTITSHIVHKNWVCASRSRVDGVGIVDRETQLLASDAGIIGIETVVANGAPLALMVNLQPTA